MNEQQGFSLAWFVAAAVLLVSGLDPVTSAQAQTSVSSSPSVAAAPGSAVHPASGTAGAADSGSHKGGAAKSSKLSSIDHAAWVPTGHSAASANGPAAANNKSATSGPGPGAASKPAAATTAGAPSVQKSQSGKNSAVPSKIDHAAWVPTRSGTSANGATAGVASKPGTGSAGTVAASQPAAAPTPGAASARNPSPGKNSAGLSRIDHEAWVPSHKAASSTASAPPAVSVSAPKPSSQPVAAATPATAPAAPQPAVRAHAAPGATSAPGGAPTIAARPAAPASPAPLSPIDHAIWVSNPAASAGSDHILPSPDHRPIGKWIPTPGQELWTSLHLPPHAIKPGEQELWDTRDDSFDDPINWSLTARKIAHVVEVYYKGRLFGSYRAVFGRNPDHMAKEWEGDLRTPEGMYVIVSKSYNSRWRRFLRLNYPNSMDRDHYETMLHEGLIPVSATGRVRPLGGSIGIHGTDRPRFNRVLVNWTLGCISVDNDIVIALDQLLPVGTLVLIKP